MRVRCFPRQLESLHVFLRWASTCEVIQHSSLVTQVFFPFIAKRPGALRPPPFYELFSPADLRKEFQKCRIFSCLFFPNVIILSSYQIYIYIFLFHFPVFPMITGVIKCTQVQLSLQGFLTVKKCQPTHSRAWHNHTSWWPGTTLFSLSV